MDLFAHDAITDEPPDGYEVLHDREYRVRAYRTPEDGLLLRGAVRDQKPPQLYIAEDSDPLTVHHMQVDIYVEFPDLLITAVNVGFETHPETLCPTITEHYQHLVGLSITRGFTGRVRELFGGPRGCTHVTALLNAMAPVAVQCFWSMEASNQRRRPNGQVATVTDADADDSIRQAGWARNVNSCHVWSEDGEVVAGIKNGEPKDSPLFIQRRLVELGLDPTTKPF